MCCGLANAENRDDVAFIGALIEHVDARLPIDADRVYLTGFSNGCSLAQRIAVHRSHQIAAVACYSNYLFDEPAPGYEPVPILQIHGTSDSAIPYEPSGVLPGAVENAAAWAGHNGCAGEPGVTRTNVLVTYRYPRCRSGAEVIHLAIVDGEHVPPPEFNEAEAIWEFLDRH